MGENDFFEKGYIKPYTRIGPYIVGILLGYAITYFKNNPSYERTFKKVKIFQNFF